MATSTLFKQLSLTTAVGAVAVGMTMGAGVMSPAEAVTLYTDQNAFNNATQGLTNIDFEGLASTGSFVYYDSGLTQSGVTFTGSGGYLFVVDSAFSPNFYDWGSGAVLIGNQGGTVTAVLPSGVTAVGSDIMSILNYASEFVVNLSTGDSYTVNSSNYPELSFVGLTSDVDITSISFTATSGYTELDNFTFGSAKSVPEPASIAGLLAISMIGATSMRKRKQPQKAISKA